MTHLRVIKISVLWECYRISSMLLFHCKQSNILCQGKPNFWSLFKMTCLVPVKPWSWATMQMTVHNGSGKWGFLKNNSDKRSYCSWLSCLYPPFQCFVCIGLILWEARAEVHAASCWDAAQSNQSWALPSTVPMHTPTFFPPHTSLWSPGSCHTSRIFLPVKTFNFFLTTPFLFNTMSCLQALLFFSTN